MISRWGELEPDSNFTVYNSVDRYPLRMVFLNAFPLRCSCDPKRTSNVGGSQEYSSPDHPRDQLGVYDDEL